MATDGPWTSARIRAALLEHRQAVGGGGYPAALRERAVRCVQRMRARGVSISEIATKLGIMASTASDWSGNARGVSDGSETLSFVPVVVEEQDRAQAGQGRFEIAFPTGVVLRVECVDGDAMTAAIAALSAKEQS